MKIRHLALASTLAVAAPIAGLDARAAAAPAVVDQWGAPAPQAIAYREGYTRGVRAGQEDRRRNQSFAFTDESDFRNGSAGYRPQYGDRLRYRDEFRRGFAEGYRVGYQRPDDSAGRARRGAPPWATGRGSTPWANGRGSVPYGRGAQYDLAIATGYNDGYERGLDDGRDRRRNDPVGEGRYRDGDHGYKREYGPREVYKIRYREGFLQGYTRGYEDGRRYGGRSPSWWPFRD